MLFVIDLSRFKKFNKKNCNTHFLLFVLNFIFIFVEILVRITQVI